MTPPDALQEFLAQQRAEYRASLPGRLALLEAGWERAAAGDPDALKDLERCAHGLAGSAGTFGLAAIGQAARALEDTLERCSAGAPWDARTAATAAAQVEALRNLLRAAIAGPPDP